MAKIDELHNYAYPSSYLDELHKYDSKDHSQNDIHIYGNRGAVYGGLDEVHLYGGYQTVAEDEINTSTNRPQIDIDEYFDEIEDFDEDQKEERKDLAKDFRDILMLILMLILADLRVGNEVNVGFYHSLAKSRLMDAIDGRIRAVSTNIYREIEEYIDTNVEQILDSTMRHTDDAYYFSESRATAIAVDDAMATVNLEELDDAIKAGYTHKIWITVRDNKVRHSHELVDGKRVEIDKSFNVGRCKMIAPMVFAEDSDFQDAKEIVNCRCHCIYSNRKTD